jgi:hypothetical protein
MIDDLVIDRVIGDRSIESISVQRINGGLIGPTAQLMTH